MRGQARRALAVDMLVDTHCHLNHEELGADVEGAIERARAAGVGAMIVVGFDLPSSAAAVALAEKHTELYATVGVHPHDASTYSGDVDVRLRELAAHPRVVSIGEIGLDYHYEHSPRAEQFAALRAQLRLARDVRLPVVFHCRDAYADLLDLAEADGIGPAGAVMHCWAGTQAEAERALAAGSHLGFGGILTFKSAESIREAAALAPLDRLLLETDAPYLAPVPHRGKRNEPAYVRLVATRLAELRGIELRDIADATTANALDLFKRMAG